MSATDDLGGQGQGDAGWTSGLDEDNKGFVSNKGWDSPGAAVKAYRELESRVGRSITVPGDNDDPTAWDKVYNKLGRPESPDKYGIQAPEGQSDAFAKWASENFHKAGLSTKQAATLVEQWGEFSKQQSAAVAEAQEGQAKSQAERLRTEWGADYEKNFGLAKTAAQQFGVQGDVIDALENQLGYDGVMKFFREIGVKMGEGDFHEGGASFNFGGLTPSQAQAELNRMYNDKEWSAAFHNPNKNNAEHKEAVAKKQALMALAYPES